MTNDPATPPADEPREDELPEAGTPDEPVQDDAPPSPTLEAALERFDLTVPAEAIEPLHEYCRLLWDWNQKLNLTRHTDYDKFVSRDLLDVLQLSPLLAENEEVLDVGSGGGVPGIPLAILRPDLQISLCESIGKKAKVLGDMTADLGLPTPVFHARAENVLADFSYDSLVARAVGPLWKMMHWFEGQWHTFGRLLAVKGPNWPEERGEARHRGYMNKLELRRLVSYTRPGADGESVVLQVNGKRS